MKRIIVIALIATMMCVSVMAEAPNSGDGESDGSGWTDVPPQDGEGTPNPNDNAESIGPAPDSGDGVPGGSGF